MTSVPLAVLPLPAETVTVWSDAALRVLPAIDAGREVVVLLLLMKNPGPRMLLLVFALDGGMKGWFSERRVDVDAWLWRDRRGVGGGVQNAAICSIKGLSFVIPQSSSSLSS